MERLSGCFRCCRLRFGPSCFQLFESVLHNFVMHTTCVIFTSSQELVLKFLGLGILQWMWYRGCDVAEMQCKHYGWHNTNVIKTIQRILDRKTPLSILESMHLDDVISISVLCQESILLQHLPEATVGSAWTLALICGKVFHYSEVICSSSAPFLATLHLFLLSTKHREKAREKLGQQPSAHCCHTDSLCFEWFSPPPPPIPMCWRVWFLHSLSASPHPPTLCLLFSLSLFWSRFICLCTQSLLRCRSVQCPTLLCSVSFSVFSF